MKIKSFREWLKLSENATTSACVATFAFRVPLGTKKEEKKPSDKKK